MSAHPEPHVVGWCIYVPRGEGFQLMGKRARKAEHVLADLAEGWWRGGNPIPVRVVRANVVPA